MPFHTTCLAVVSRESNHQKSWQPMIRHFFSFVLVATTTQNKTLSSATKYDTTLLPDITAFTMFSPSLILVVILGLFLSLPATEAFVGNDSCRQRKGARGQTAASTRTSPATASATALHMAPKKSKKKSASTAETLRKKDVVAAVADRCDMSKGGAEAAVSAVFDVISDIVVEGNRVNVAGFGTFEPRERAGRKGRNPKTGEEITIQASTNCGFSAAKQFKDRLNGRD